VVVSDELDEGTYIFLAETTNDEIIFGQAELSFDLLDAANIDLCESIVDINNIVVSWGAVEDAEPYKIEISAEDDENDSELELEVSSDTNSFIIPEPLLESNATYTVEIGAINDAGNITATQCEFSVN
jgi:hypothetical protein